MLPLARLAPHACIGLLSALSLLAAAPRASEAQDGCVFGDQGNDVYQRQTLPGGGTITYVRRPHFVCDDGVQIWADSAVAYSVDALSHLIGRVRYRDAARELTANEARYFSNVGRLQANGRVRVVGREDGSLVENGDLVYLRVTSYRDEESMTVTTGRDALRPRAVMPSPRPDSAAADSAIAPRASTPYTVVADRIFFRGNSYFDATGDVEIERDSLFAYGDSAEYVEETERLVLVGSARVLSADYTLVGRTITIGTDPAGASEIHALKEALLTGEDLTVTAPQIRLYLAEGTMERLVAVPLREEGEGPGEEQASVPRSPADAAAPDSADLARPVAVAERFQLTADSLELTAPASVVDRIFAAGRARSVSEARDSLNVEALPALARQDWLEGDTILVFLLPPRADSVAPAAAPAQGEEREYRIERIVARVGARSLYRLPAQDSTARAGLDPPAVHYVVGDEITIHMLEGEVEAMVVVGQTRGVHLEPLSRAAARDTTGAGAPAAPGILTPSLPAGSPPGGPPDTIPPRGTGDPGLDPTVRRRP